jgi:hypothetical protein
MMSRLRVLRPIIITASGEPRLAVFRPRSSTRLLLLLAKRVQATLQHLRMQNRARRRLGRFASSTQRRQSLLCIRTSYTEALASPRLAREVRAATRRSEREPRELPPEQRTERERAY